MCLGKDEDDFYNNEEAEAFFVRHSREQFCDKDMYAAGRGFMAAAVKLVNPMYGTSDSTAEFDLLFELEGEEKPIHFENCKLILNQFEYTSYIWFFVEIQVQAKPLLQILLVKFMPRWEFCRKEM